MTKIGLVCNKCKHELSGDWTHRVDGQLSIDPCEDCLKIEGESARQDGYDEGYEEGEGAHE